MNEVFNKFHINKSKRQKCVAKKPISHAKFENIEETPAVRKCQKAKCTTCPYLQEGQYFRFKSGRNFNVHFSFTCKGFNYKMSWMWGTLHWSNRGYPQTSNDRPPTKNS